MDTMHTDQLKRIIEAALLASSQPLSLTNLAALFVDEPAPATAAMAKAIELLQAETEGRGVELVEVASGYRYQVRTDIHPWVSRLWVERQARYSRALLETLSLIAYRQPVTRGEIEQVRGVAVSTNIVRTLEEREWIRVVGYRDVPGKPALYGTTRAFLDYFKLKSLDEMPSLIEVRDLGNIDPQLDFSAEPAARLVSIADDDVDPAAGIPVAETVLREGMIDDTSPAPDDTDTQITEANEESRA